MRGRVRLTNGDRFFFIQLYRWFPSVVRSQNLIPFGQKIRTVEKTVSCPFAA
jgi:hypothetical protein